jgi:hypothetical protein
MRWSVLALTATIALSFGVAPAAATEENAEDFMAIHKIEIIFHEAGTTKNLDLMMSLFAEDATLTSAGKTYQGKDQQDLLAGRWAVPTSEPVGCIYPSVSDQVCGRR